LSGKRYDPLPPTDSPKKLLRDGWIHSINLDSDDPIHNDSPLDIQRQSFGINDLSRLPPLGSTTKATTFWKASLWATNSENPSSVWWRKKTRPSAGQQVCSRRRDL
jgi:hypothetical protein